MCAHAKRTELIPTTGYEHLQFPAEELPVHSAGNGIVNITIGKSKRNNIIKRPWTKVALSHRQNPSTNRNCGQCMNYSIKLFAHSIVAICLGGIVSMSEHYSCPITLDDFVVSGLFPCESNMFIDHMPSTL